jgi:hypothetical protein
VPNFLDNCAEVRSTTIVLYFIFSHSYPSKKIDFDSWEFRGMIYLHIIWEANALKHFQSVRREDEFDFVLHHVCSCGHEQREHLSDLMDSSNEECSLGGCDCIRFLP